MTNYNDGKWHGWNGGECPVHPKTIVEVLFDDGSGAGEHRTADSWLWGKVLDHPVAFRVIEEHKEPREFWVFPNGHGDLCVSSTYHEGGLHVREVTDE